MLNDTYYFFYDFQTPCVSQQDLAKNRSKSQTTKKNRESLFTFYISSADLPSILRIFDRKISKS